MKYCIVNVLSGVNISTCNGLVSLAESLNTDFSEPKVDQQKDKETMPEHKTPENKTETDIKRCEPPNIKDTCQPTPTYQANETDETMGITQDIGDDSVTGTAVRHALLRDSPTRTIIDDESIPLTSECAASEVDPIDSKTKRVCYQCGQVFSSEEQYKGHFTMTKCCLVCQTCGTELPDIHCLTLHDRLHAEEIPKNFNAEFVEIMNVLNKGEETDAGFFCKSCCLYFKNRELFEHHTIDNHSVIFTCKYCNVKLNTFLSLHLHNNCQTKVTDVSSTCGIKHADIKTKESSDKPDSVQYMEADTCEVGKKTASKFTCAACNMAFKSSFTLKRHTRSKHPEEWFTCEICDKKYPSEDALKNHKVSHDVKFQCTFENCDKSCKSQRHLDLHLQSHVDKGPFVCALCRRTFPSQGKLNGHQQYHTTERTYTCDFCQKSYKTVEVLNRHARIHNTTCRFYCEVCGKGFNQAGSLKRHKDTHDNIKRYKCDKCNDVFSQNMALQIHKLNANHFKDSQEKSDKTISCEHCNKLFIKEGKHLYDKHMLTHTGQKPYKCDVCQKRFNDRSNLNAHRKIHSDAKPFRCNLCDKSFIHRNQLQKHTQNHETNKDETVTKAASNVKPKSSKATTTKVSYTFTERKNNTKGTPTVVQGGASNVTNVNRISDRGSIVPTDVSVKDDRNFTVQQNQVEIPSSGVTSNIPPTYSIITPMSSLLSINSSSPNMNMPLNIVYDTSSILQLASVSAGVVDVSSMFPQSSYNLQRLDSYPEQSPTKETSDEWQESSVTEEMAAAPVDDAEDTVESQEEMDDGAEDQDSTWRQMNTMFTCKSPKDIDHAHDNWM